jgi:hypothetical protein
MKIACIIPILFVLACGGKSSSTETKRSLAMPGRFNTEFIKNQSELDSLSIIYGKAIAIIRDRQDTTLVRASLESKAQYHFKNLQALQTEINKLYMSEAITQTDYDYFNRVTDSAAHQFRQDVILLKRYHFKFHLIPKPKASTQK